MRVITLTGYRPSPRYDDTPWTHARIEGAATASGEWATIETLALDPVDADPSDPQERNLTTEEATEDHVWFRIVFLDADDDEDIPTAATTIPAAAFATALDISKRLGRELTEAEDGTVELLLESIGGLIAEAVNQPPGWVPEPVPSTVRMLVIEKIVGVLTNPRGFASFSRQIGTYNESGTFPRASDIGIFLSEEERRRVRRALGTSAFASSTLTTPYSDGARNVLDFELSDL